MARMTTRIRFGTADDAQLLTDLGARTFYDAYTPDIPAQIVADFLPEIFSLALQTAELADPGTIFFLAEINGEAAGYAMLSEGTTPDELVDKRAIKLPRIYLNQAATGHGLGSKLMQACLDEAGRRGFEVIWLGVWDKNVRAQRFYQRWGFVKFGAEEFQFGPERQIDLLFFRPISR